MDESVFGIPEEEQTENKSESSKQKVDTKGQKEQSENTEIPEGKTAKTLKGTIST